MDDSAREIKASKLRKHSFLKKINVDNEAATEVSFQIARKFSLKASL
jgi:hypothetical protein